MTADDDVGLTVVVNEMTGAVRFPGSAAPSAHYLSGGSAVVSGSECRDVVSAQSVVLVEAGEEVHFDVDEPSRVVTFVADQ